MKCLILLLFSALTLNAEDLTKGPWFNQYVNGVDREPARATSYSFATAEDALACDRDASRMVSLNGTWKFAFAEDLSKADFEAILG